MAGKRFNITGLCFPEEHYMVDLTERLGKIKEMVDRGDYFCINRGRQYGKTTTLRALREHLKEEYVVVPLSFEGLGNAAFESERSFVRSFARLLLDRTAQNGQAERERATLDIVRGFLESDDEKTFQSLTSLITRICGSFTRPCVMLIDEVDQASNFEVFVNFLAALRELYLNRNSPTDWSTFLSVVLAGVHDIRHLKSKIRPESEHNKQNSPWNIAAQFKVDMSFSKKEIEKMLLEYKGDRGVKMNAATVAKEIYDYTAGYPVMVCWLCKCMDEDLGKWTRASVGVAAKQMVTQYGVDVFGSMAHQLADHPELAELLVDIVVNGSYVKYRPMDPVQSLGVMFCYLKDNGGRLAVANRLFEMSIMINYSDFAKGGDVNGEEIDHEASCDRSLYIEGGKLNMDKLMAGFQKLYRSIFCDKDERFIEKYGRKIFLTYLKPIINGGGSYYMEAQTRDELRTDLVVDYNGERFVIEMKIWRGDSYNKKGEEQLAKYLDYYKIKKGYLLSFCFNKTKEQQEPEIIKVGDREVLETLV